MNKRVKQTKIDGKDIQIHMLKGSVGVAMSHKLSTVVAGFFTGEEEINIDFGKIAESLASKLPYEELQMMIDALLKDMAIDGKEIDFDEYFAGNYGFLTRIITFALQENFGSFFEGLATLGE